MMLSMRHVAKSVPEVAFAFSRQVGRHRTASQGAGEGQMASTSNRMAIRSERKSGATPPHVRRSENRALSSLAIRGFLPTAETGLGNPRTTAPGG